MMKLLKLFYLALVVSIILGLSSQALAQKDKKPPLDPKAIKKAMISSDDGIKKGQETFTKLCSACHGKSGDGNTPVAKSLKPAPRDFTKPEIKWRAGKEPAEVFNTISNGFPGSAMIGYKKSLDEIQRWELVHFINSLAGSKGQIKLVTNKNLEKVFKDTEESTKESM